MLTQLTDHLEFCPGHLSENIDDKKPPFPVRPRGLKPCAKKKYHTHDLDFPEKKKKIIITCFMILY